MNMESLRVAALPRLRHLRVTHLSSFRLQPFLETYAHLESLDIQVTSHGGARTGLFRALTTLPHLTAARLHLSVAANDEATQEEGGVLRMPSLQSLVISCRNATSGAEIFPSTLWAPVLTRLTLTASCLPARRVRLAFPTLQELTVDQHCFTRDDPDSAERVRPPAEAPAAGWVQSAVEGRPLRLTVLGGGVRTATDSMVWAVTRLADRLTEMSLCFKELNEVSLRRLLQPVRLQLTALHLSVDSISMESSRSLHARHLDLIHCPRLRRLYLRPATLAFPFRSITLHPEFEYL